MLLPYPTLNTKTHLYSAIDGDLYSTVIVEVVAVAVEVIVGLVGFLLLA